jgi:hypothetical protein
LQFDLDGVSGANEYSVNPLASGSTVTSAICAVPSSPTGEAPGLLAPATATPSSTRAATDTAAVTVLATQMVREFGLSHKMGPVGYTSPPAGHPGFAPPRSYSEHTQWLVDQEVAAILAKAGT